MIVAPILGATNLHQTRGCDVKNKNVMIFLAGLLSCWNLAFGQTANADFTNNMSLQTGNASVAGIGNNQAITFQGGNSLPPVGMVAIPSHQAPSVFQYIPNNFGMPAEVTGMALEVFYDQKCQPEEDVEGESRVMEKDGGSNLTKITFTTHPSVDSIKRGDKPVKVRTDLSGGKNRYRCLGILTAVADKAALERGQPVGLSVLTSDMRRAVRAEFIGMPNDIVIVSAAKYWGGAVGVANDSTGVSLGGSLVNIVGRLTSLAVAPGVSGGSGVSSPVARSGITALILMQVPDDDPQGIVIGLADVKSPFGEVPVTPSGSNGRKAEAEKH